MMSLVFICKVWLLSQIRPLIDICHAEGRALVTLDFGF